MSATAEEMQEELDAIIANAEERAALIQASADRAKFLDDPVNEFGHGVTQGIAQTAGVPVDIVNTLANAVGMSADAPIGSGDNIQDVLEFVQGTPEGIDREESSGVVGAAGEGAGMAAVMSAATIAPVLKQAMDPNFDLNQAADIGKFQGTGPGTAGHIPRSRASRMAFGLKQVAERIARTAVKNPKTVIAGELMGGAAAGAAVEQVDQMGRGTGEQMAAGLGAGIVAGLTPSAIPRMTRNMWRWGMRNILPFTEAGAEARAATQMQVRTADPEAAAAKVRELIAADEASMLSTGKKTGITPARATGEEALMAQERRVMEDDIVLDKQVREDLTEATRRAEMELRSLYDTPRGREAWEQSIFQRVAPEGVEVPVGTSEEMLDTVYDSFKPLYNEIKGYPIQPNLFGSRNTPLDVMIKNVPESNRIQAQQATRDAVGRRLKSIYAGFDRKVKPNSDGLKLADSEDYLKLRQDIRAEARKRSKAGDQESVALYKIAEEKVNQVLRSQLEPEVMQRLAVIDSNYRNYKVVEDAVYRVSGTDKGLTPEGLLQSLKASASSKGSYARGEQLELRSAAVSGKPIAKMLEDVPMIRRNAARMGEEDLVNTQNDFFDTLMRKSMDSEDVLERVDGEKLKGLLHRYAEQASALRVDEGTMARANSVADELITAQRRSPAAVTQLYEDGPENILQLIATIAGAQRGQAIAGRGIGSSMVLASYFANKARSILGHITTDQARALLVKAQTDPKLYEMLLTKPDIKAVAQNEAAEYIRSFLAVSAKPGVEKTADYYEQLEELRRTAESR